MSRFNQVDTDDSNYVSFDEFLILLRPTSTGATAGFGTGAGARTIDNAAITRPARIVAGNINNVLLFPEDDDDNFSGRKMETLEELALLNSF